jgi:hypothetical protein
MVPRVAGGAAGHVDEGGLTDPAHSYGSTETPALAGASMDTQWVRTGDRAKGIGCSLDS